MKSPVANHLPMTPETLSNGLPVFRCPETKGIFIPSANYWRWLHLQPERLPHLPEPSEISPPPEDSSEAKICPETGALMLRYQVGHGFDFSIDRSPAGSIWLDDGEWEALEQRQFHDELHLVFTAPWQKQIRDESRANSHEERSKERLGEDLYTRLLDLRRDLENHPEKGLALALLQQQDEE